MHGRNVQPHDPSLKLYLKKENVAVVLTEGWRKKKKIQ